MTTRKLCSPCAKDTAVSGRCEKLEAINKPGTICDRCLNNGRLLVSYRICCEPTETESRFGHTHACKKARQKSATLPMLQRFAVALFCTDARVLAIVDTALGHSPIGPTERLGRAWDLAADGHEPEATYRKEAEDRAFRMNQFDRKLSEYAAETKRLTRESNAQAAVRNVAQANARLPGPLPQSEHLANVRKHQEAERAALATLSARRQAERDAEDERKRVERAARREVHVEGQARVVTRDPAPAGDLIVRETPSTGGNVLGMIEKDSIVAVLRSATAFDNRFVAVQWRGGNRHPPVTGFVLKQYLRMLDTNRLAEPPDMLRNEQMRALQAAGILPPHHPLTEDELHSLVKAVR